MTEDETEFLSEIEMQVGEIIINRSNLDSSNIAKTAANRMYDSED